MVAVAFRFAIVNKYTLDIVCVCGCRVCRVGEKAIQRIGLAAPSNDANTGDIEAPLHSFSQMRDGLKEIQAQVNKVSMVEAFSFSQF